MPFAAHIRHLLILTGLLACALAPQGQLLAQQPPRMMRVQIYYWHRSNSNFAETMDNFGQRPEPRFLEPITLWYRSGEKFDRVRVRAGQRSDPFTVPVASKDIVFYRQDPSNLKEIPPEIILNVAVPSYVEQGLIITRDSDLSRAEVIDVSDTRIPKGSMRLVNQTTQPIVVKIGEQVTPLKPGDSAVIAAKTDADGHTPVMMARQDKNGAWSIFYSSVLTVDKTNRMLVMLYPTAENSKNVKVQLMTLPT